MCRNGSAANSTSSDDIGHSGDHQSGDMNKGRFHTTVALESFCSRTVGQDRAFSLLEMYFVGVSRCCSIIARDDS
jgi:hypothetical protein